MKKSPSSVPGAPFVSLLGFACAALITFVVPPVTTLRGQAIAPEAAVSRIGDYVERYYARAQSLMADEEVTIQPLRSDLGNDGFARRLTYELRVEWNPDAPGDESPARVTRQLMEVNGRPPRAGQEPQCLDPRDVSPEPLAFLLPDRRGKFVFTSAGVGQVDGRPAIMIDYRSARPEAPKAEWKDECVSVDLPGRARGRVWADPETFEIVRLDEGLTGMVDIRVPIAQQRRGASMYMTIERADSSIRYRRITFTDPDETMVLPTRIETVNVVRNSGSPRVRIVQAFGNYRRFVTTTRVVQ